MQLITYDEAIKILSISSGTLKHAINERRVLTKAGRNGRNMLLIKEQVMLFTGVNPNTGNKKRLSFEALTPAEKQQWHELAAMMDNGTVTSKQEIPIEQIEETVKRVAREESRKETEDTLRPLKDVLDRMFNHPKQPAVA